jgi:hypothetical protein
MSGSYLNASASGTTVSYPYIILGCMPGIGPLLSLYDSAKMESVLSQFKHEIRTINAELAANQLFKTKQPICSIKESSLETRKFTLIAQCKNILAKLILFSKCGMVSNLLTLAGIITLIALGALSGPVALIPILFCLIGILCHYLQSASATAASNITLRADRSV